MPGPLGIHAFAVTHTGLQNFGLRFYMDRVYKDSWVSFNVVHYKPSPSSMDCKHLTTSVVLSRSGSGRTANFTKVAADLEPKYWVFPCSQTVGYGFRQTEGS